MARKYYFTDHFITRLHERFPKLEVSWDNKDQLYLELESILENSTEEKGYLNTEYMLYLQKEYGVETKYEFRANRDYDLLFVVVDKRAITCWRLNESNNVMVHKKFVKNKNIDRSVFNPKSRNLRSIMSEYEAQAQYEEMVNNGLYEANERLNLITYELIYANEEIAAIKCLKCDTTSTSRFNIENRYCNNCKAFHDDPKLKENKTYKILLNQDNKEHAIKCGRCGKTSYNINDVKEKYCGCCNMYHEMRIKI